MEIELIAGIIVFGWVFLCVLSNERENLSNARSLRSSPSGGDEPAHATVDTAKN